MEKQRPGPSGDVEQSNHHDAAQQTRQGPTSPYLRPLGEGPIPTGWVAESVRGGWRGQATEIVFDPRRHEIAITWLGAQSDANGPQLNVVYNHRNGKVALIQHTAGAAALDEVWTALGWERLEDDGHSRLWIRDRLHAARAALTQLDQGTHGTAPTTTPEQQVLLRIAAPRSLGEATL